jgi:hypothetical protein
MPSFNAYINSKVIETQKIPAAGQEFLRPVAGIAFKMYENPLKITVLT